jgi:hypothetical protein
MADAAQNEGWLLLRNKSLSRREDVTSKRRAQRKPQYQEVISEGSSTWTRTARFDDQLGMVRRSEAIDLHVVSIQVRRKDAEWSQARAGSRIRKCFSAPESFARKSAK